MSAVTGETVENHQKPRRLFGNIPAMRIVRWKRSGGVRYGVGVQIRDTPMGAERSMRRAAVAVAGRGRGAGPQSFMIAVAAIAAHAAACSAPHELFAVMLLYAGFVSGDAASPQGLCGSPTHRTRASYRGCRQIAQRHRFVIIRHLANELSYTITLTCCAEGETRRQEAQRCGCCLSTSRWREVRCQPPAHRHTALCRVPRTQSH